LHVYTIIGVIYIHSRVEFFLFNVIPTLTSW
jgi:hypothetical protein